MADDEDVILDDNGACRIEGGDFVIGDGTLDDCFLILKLNTGALKSDPILGPNLIRMINSKQTTSEMKQTIQLHMARDNKNFKKLDIINGNIDFEL